MSHTIVQLFTADEYARDEGFAIMAGPVLYGMRLPTLGVALATIKIFDGDINLTGEWGMREAFYLAQKLPECECGGRMDYDKAVKGYRCNICGQPNGDEDGRG